MITIATMGKFDGIPTRKASAKYGGGTSAGVEYINRPHKFPSIKIRKLDVQNDDINILVTNLEDDEDEI